MTTSGMECAGGEVFLGLRLPDHGDQRLNRRQVAIQHSLASAARSGVSAPSAMGSSAATEAYYRLLRNQRVMPDQIIAPHIADAYQQPISGRLLVAHDTTDIYHTTASNADDVYDLGGRRRGYRTHVSLLIDELHRAPIGVGHLEVVERPETKGPEGERWHRGVETVAQETDNRDTVIHLCDSEGDAYSLMARIIERRQDFVIRECYDRLVRIENRPEVRILSIAKDLPIAGQYSVEVPKRKRVSARPKEKKRTHRSRRTATLDVRFCEVRVQRPKKLERTLPNELAMWFVWAKESDPPEAEDPIDWRLWVTLPVDSLSDATSSLELYKSRWRIEELFNALKNGCGFAKTRFESRSTSECALALHLPVAVGLLRLRALAETGNELPAHTVVDDVQLQVLRTLDKKLPDSPTAVDVMWSVARMGGFLPQNKRAGWLVLGRGFTKLITMSTAWKLARGHPLSPLEKAAATM